MSDNNDVGKFHRKFGLPTAAGLGQAVYLPRDVINFRLKFLLEELTELAEGYGLNLHYQLTEKYDAMGELLGVTPDKQDLPKIADALIDLVYVAHGTAHMHGFRWQPLWDEVQRANMSKERAKADGSNSARSHSLDVVKPEGWKGPNITGVLMAYGWPGPRLPLDGE